MNDRRAAQVFTPGIGSGSGYCVRADLILTARHVLHRKEDPPPPPASQFKVRLWGDIKTGNWEWLEASLLWTDPIRDIALLSLKNGEIVRSFTLASWEDSRSVSKVFGRLPDSGQFDCHAFGWPRVMIRPDVNEPLPYTGKLTAYGRTAQSPIRTFGHELAPTQAEGWAGMSGAALFVDDALVGVVTLADGRFQGHILEASPIAAIEGTSPFWEHLGGRSIREIAAIRPVPLPSERRPNIYIERPELTDRLIAFFLADTPAAPGTVVAAVVHGFGGMGKTTVAIWLTWSTEIDKAFPDGRLWVSLGSEPRDALPILNDWIAQFDPTARPMTSLEAARSELGKLLRDRRVLFVIDDVWPETQEAAEQLAVASPRSCYLYTTRSPHLASLLGAESFALGEMDTNQSMLLLERNLGRALDPAVRPFAEQLREIVDGHPLALELAAARLKDGLPWARLLSDLGAEIARLETLEEAGGDLVAKRTHSKTPNRRHSVQASLLLSVGQLTVEGQRLFFLLGTLAEKAVLSPRAAATLWSLDEYRSTSALVRLWQTGLLGKTANGYRLHGLVHDLARQLLVAAPDTYRGGQLVGLGMTLSDASRQLLTRYRNRTQDGRWHTLTDDGYLFDHLIWHLTHAGWHQEIEQLFWEETEGGRCGWFQARDRADQPAGFLADLQQAQRLADTDLVAAADHTVRASALARQQHYALIRASVTSVSARVSSGLLWLAVKHGVVTVKKALVLARSQPDPLERAHSILGLVDRLAGQERTVAVADALAAAGVIEDPDRRAECLCRCAPLVEPRDVAVATALAIDKSKFRAQALRHCAALFPCDERRAIAGSIEIPYHRALALAELACLLPNDERTDVLDEARRGLDAIPDGWELDRLKGTLAPMLPPAEALIMARSIAAPDAKIAALTAILGVLPEGLSAEALDDVFATARSADASDDRTTKALLALLGVLPENRHAGVMDAAAAHAESIADAGAQAAALMAIAKVMPGSERQPILKRALELARSTFLDQTRQQDENEEDRRHRVLNFARFEADPAWREELLLKLFIVMSDQDWEKARDDALNRLRSLNRGEDRIVRDWSLASITAALPDEEERRLAIAREYDAVCVIGDADAVHGALHSANRAVPVDLARVIAGFVAGHAPDALLSIVEGWEASANAEVTKPHRLASLWIEVARRLPEAERGQALDEALVAARSISSWYRGRRADMLASISTLVPEDKVSPQPPRRFSATSHRNPRVNRLRTRTAGRRAEQIPDKRSALINEALNEARQLQYLDRTIALEKIAQHLAGNERLQVMEEILGGFDEDWFKVPRLRAHAGTAYARLLTEPLFTEEDQRAWLDGVLRVLPYVEQAPDFGQWRAYLLLAPMLKESETAPTLRRILEYARTIHWSSTSDFIVELIALLPVDEALAAARAIDDNTYLRAQALAAVAPAFANTASTNEAIELWKEIMGLLADSKRAEVLTCYAMGLGELSSKIGNDETATLLVRSIMAVVRWWP